MLKHTQRILPAAAAMSAVFLGGSLVANGDDEVAPPSEVVLTGTVRDFREKNHEDGHPDFEVRPSGGYGLYAGNIARDLDEQGKPVFIGGGYKLTSPYKDSSNRPIAWTMYDSSLGDSAGNKGVDSSGGITSAESFAEWFRDVPGANISDNIELTFKRQADGNYVFDDKQDDRYANLGGFFPIENALFGNPGGSPDRNFHFTFEMNTTFVYKEGSGQVFRFTGDDDVWVFINNKLVIDLSGVHSALDQYVELDRLDLEDGETYPLSFFFAERHRTQSNFRIETTLELTPRAATTTTLAFD
ncbi:MAG: fibro-slime domain-containing protein [Phycisphaerales bacterium]